MAYNHKSILITILAAAVFHSAQGFNIVLAGGTGNIGATLSSSLANDGHAVTILSRNAFLAAARTRPRVMYGVVGWVGRSFLEKHPGITLRDWDGGDLLDIGGNDWMGWQEDTLAKADAVVNLVGGFNEHRALAAERLVRESLRVNPTALQITVGPRDDELKMMSPVGVPTKVARLKQCEDLVSTNLANFECVRVEANRVEEECGRIKEIIYDRLK
jgi:hypothetical protein